jgi:hypothetical protein
MRFICGSLLDVVSAVKAGTRCENDRLIPYRNITIGIAVGIAIDTDP